MCFNILYRRGCETIKMVPLTESDEMKNNLMVFSSNIAAGREKNN